MTDILIVCWTRCWWCQLGGCSRRPHTWMDEEDIEHEGMRVPTTREQWARLARLRPCGCWCVSPRYAAHRARLRRMHHLYRMRRR